MKKQMRLFITILIIGTLFMSSFFYSSRKDNIHYATIAELDNVREIGEVLSDRIYVYVQTNGTEDVDELKGHIKYLGEVRLKELKKIYK